jgi:hypothetical protein
MDSASSWENRMRLLPQPIMFGGKRWSVGIGFLTNIAIYIRSNGTFINFEIGQLRFWPPKELWKCAHCSFTAPEMEVHRHNDLIHCSADGTPH